MALLDVNWRPDRRQLRWFAAAGAVVFAGVGTWVFFRRSLFGLELADGPARTVGIVLWCAAGAFAAGGAAAPRALLPAYWTLTAIGLPIGFVLSHVILAGVFYGVFTPVALVFRLIGRDALHRRFEPNARSYWVRRRPAGDVKRYFRQF
jgi:hypothetical protein